MGYTIWHMIILTIFPLILQTTLTAQVLMLSIGGIGCAWNKRRQWVPFLPRDAMPSQDVCPSVTRQYSVKTATRIIKLF